MILKIKTVDLLGTSQNNKYIVEKADIEIWTWSLPHSVYVFKSFKEYKIPK